MAVNCSAPSSTLSIVIGTVTYLTFSLTLNVTSCVVDEKSSAAVISVFYETKKAKIVLYIN